MEHEQPMNEVARKPRKRAPWWMYVIAAAFLICIAGRYYGLYVEPENPGIQYQLIPDNSGHVDVLIESVAPDSLAARAGLEPGDYILNWIQQSKVAKIWEPASSHPLYWESSHAYRLEIKRKNEIRNVSLTPCRILFINRLTSPGNLTHLLHSILYLLPAVVVAFSRPYDPAARWGALFLASLALGSFALVTPPTGWFSTVLSFPRVVGWLTVLLPSYLVASASWIGITFAAVFPRRLFHRRWIWALVWLPGGVIFIWDILIPHPPAYQITPWWPNWGYILVRILSVLGGFAVVVIPIINYLHLRDRNERRRVRIAVTGLVVTFIAAMPLVAEVNLAWWGPVKRLLPLYQSSVFPFALSLLYAAFPVSMAYAILKHRLFDIRVMIRLGLQYAAARGALLSIVPIVAVVLAGDLLLHRSQPLGDILSQRGLLYAVLAGGGLLLHLRRKVWLDALDRRFFRERYDAQRVLRAVVDEIREARSFEKVAPHVVSQIEAALHPEFASLLVRQPGEAKYRVLAAQEKAPPPIPADSKLMGLVRLLGKPVEISQSQTGWLRSQLPQQESEFLRQARLEWLFPICLAEGQTEALLAMGPKRSEEPYSREDQELLQGITSSLALLLEQSPVLAPAREEFEECPTCGTCYDTGSGRCTKEGAKLKSLPFPRLLAHRYRFEQRLGEGGMGTVYQALDTELLRQVAVKLIRSDLTASEEAAARFKQEARAAASFAHPNVVMVFDFGVAEDQRAYLVMELLRGLTLRQELSKSGRLPAARAAEVLHGVCAAVDAAHQQRLLHRDLKPENIFLVSAGCVETAKILDFGVVKPIAAGDTTQTLGQTGPGVLVGTLKYMSPEQLRGEEPAESWDLWALAVVTYEMLAGAHPFAGSTVFDVRDAVLAGRATQLHTYLPDAPPTWQHFFDQALSARVELRPASALQLFSAFVGATGRSPA